MATDSERARAWDSYIAVLIQYEEFIDDAVQTADELLEFRDERFGDGNEKPVVKAEEPATPEILPCPWCGGEAIHPCDEDAEYHYVRCDNDDCVACGPTRQSKVGAIATWNSVRG